MWKDIIKFEFSYRKARPATYIYFLLLFAIAFILVATPAKEIFQIGGLVKENGSDSIFGLTSFLGYISIFIMSAVMGVAVIRDFENNMQTLFFTTNITKFDYLFGRFVGSLLVLCLILTAIPLGLMVGQAMPWQEANRMGPFNLKNYLNPYFLIILPNTFILGSIFFSVGALGRKMIIVFMQGLVFFLLNSLISQLLSDMDNRNMASLLDPMGRRAASLQTLYWSISEKNFSQITLSGPLLYNRLFWMGIALLILAITYKIFSFQSVLNPVIKAKAKVETKVKNRFDGAILPYSVKDFGQLNIKIWTLAKVYFVETIRSLPFIALTTLGVIAFFFTAFSVKGLYGVSQMPSTQVVLAYLGVLTGLFAMIMAIIFVGDLVWRERDVRFNLIQDTLPIPSWTILLAKYIGLALAMGLVLVIAIFSGICFQTAKGYFDFNIPLYIQSLFGSIYVNILIFMLLGFFVYVIVNNKFVGHAILIFVLLSELIFDKLGILTPLLRFGEGSLMKYSEMNGFGHSVPGFMWQKAYWLFFGIIIFMLGSFWMVRGTEEKLKTRISSSTVSKNQKLVLGVLGLLFIISGIVIYYNTKVLNTYKTADQVVENQVQYEKTLKKYENAIQPKIVDVNLNIELYPSSRDYTAKGYYWLKNKNAKSVNELYILQTTDNQHIVNSLKPNVGFKLDDKYAKDFEFYIFKLQKPMLPGDSIKLDFDLSFTTKGFEKDQGNISVVNNGTFIDNHYFPKIGYEPSKELSDQNKRKEHGLKPNERALGREDSRGLANNLFGASADVISFKTTIGTEKDQIAIAPGYLEKDWQKGNRHYYTYQMNKPIANFYSIVSARYAVKKEKYKGVNLEVYYTPKHSYNIDRMVTAMKKSLDYYQTEYGPYPHKQLRIMEFPGYRSFAQSFANTIPYSENMGFVSKIDDNKDPDIVTFITAHETAHQWWGHQTLEAKVAGSAMLSETLAEYSALMLMKKSVTDLQMENFLKTELDMYFRGRSAETKKEKPLELCEQQDYIHYYKGSLVLYAIQDYVGEKTLNNGLKSFLNFCKTNLNKPKPIYPTSKDLVREIKAVLPDSLQYLATDLLQKITLYDFKTTKATQSMKDGYEVSMDLNANKMYADELGKETPQKFKEWIWIAVYGEKKNGKENIIYYQRHKIHDGQQNLKVWVKAKPTKAGIDPKHLMIDKVSSDNFKDVE